MHLNTRPTFLSFALKTLTSAVASAVLFSSIANAAGLGKLTVLSSLGQPLRAEIELTAATADEAGQLVVKLASAEAFRAANIEFNPALMALRFAVEPKNGRQVIKVSSVQPINEPFVDMLIELSGDSGRLVREYTFLLDPADLRAAQPAQVAAPAEPASQRVAPASQPARPVARPAPAPAAPVAPPAQSKAAGQVEVRAGDSLGRLAQTQPRPPGVSLDQMMVAIYRANPDAFFDGNMNRLKSGQILAVPDADTITGTNDADAKRVVVAHAADFNNYRNKLAGHVANSKASNAPDTTGQSASGKITTKVEERPTAANESRDQLKLSKTLSAAGAEEKIAKDQKLAEATARVKELEKNVSELERLMELRNKAAQPKASAPASASVSAVASASASASASAVASKPAPKPAASAPAVVAKPKPPVKKEAGIVDMLMANINYVAAGVGVLLLGGLLALRRKKPSAKAGGPSEPSILGEPSTQAPAMFDETGGQSVDTNNSVFNSSFAPSASQLDTNEVDPVAEADVYIAYGRDAQAEEILKEALRTQPERLPVRLKLLEIYAARKDPRAFEAQAKELNKLTNGTGDEWAQAAALGLTIDPLNPLYAGFGAPAPAPSAEEQDQQAMLAAQLDEAQNVADAAAMDLDLDLSADATAVPETTSAPAPAAEDNSLDFDLGGLGFEPMTLDEPKAAPAPVPAPEPVAEAETPIDMDFDLNLDAREPVAATPEPALDDFSLDLDPPAAPAPADDGLSLGDFDLPTTPEPAAVPDSLMDLDAMDFGLPAAPATPAPSEPDLSLDDFALPDMDPPATSAPAPQEFDMSSLDLDLPAAPAAPVAEPAMDAEQDESLATLADPAEMSAVHMEMETKLDLAIAYQEIGDKEGARELVEEVLKDGNAEQIAKANAMKAQLG
jgi:pilus assembly protein FimV